MDTKEAIPEAVIQGLEEVRADGDYNMWARDSVIRDMMDRADNGEQPIGIEEAEYHQGISWLVDNDDRYMEALKEMGARRARPS